jgi:twinkle protein
MDKTIREQFSQLGIETKRNHGGDKVLCPKCSHTRKNKKDPCLSIDLNTGEYNCHNNCGFKGKVKVSENYVPKPKDYIKPIFNNKTELCDGMVKFFQGRGIGQKTIKEFRISESKKYMPQLESEVTVINFNYFRDEDLVNVKYRPAKKAFMMVKDAELIFFGLNNIKNEDWCIITEGEIDCMSFYEAGVKNVVSVPNGASKGNSNLEYLDNCIEYFEKKKKIILATDNDESGMALREELARRLGYDICFKIDFNDCKDANEYLVAHGIDKLKELITEPNLIEFPMAGIITADMVWDDVKWLLENGLERGDVTEVLKEFDELVSFVPGQLMALTGIPNHGKSPFALLIMVCLSLKHRWKWGIYSPEHKPLAIFLVKICELLLGKRSRKGVGFSSNEMDLSRSFINDHFFFIEPDDDDYTLDNILLKGKQLVTRKGIRGLLIDPWNKLEHNMTKGDNETMYISKELDKVIKFNQRNSVFSIIIAHPTKIRKNLKTGLYEVPNLYDIAGSANWFNKVDIGVCFYRNYDTELSEIHVQKIKYDHLGKQGMVEVKYNMNSSRFNDLYGDYDNSNWLLPKEPQSAINYSEPLKLQPNYNFDKNEKTEPYPF